MAGEKLQAAYNDYPESATPSTPATGYVRVYAKSDGKMYRKDDTGTESELGGGTGTIADTALSNLAAVAINTSLISDTDNTDDLGSSAIKWRAAYTNATYLEERSAPSTPSSGDLVLYADSNGKPYSLNDGGVSRMLGTMTEIVAATTLGSSQTTITLSSIPAHFQDLLLVVRARSTGVTNNMTLTFNADTGANYSVNYTTWNTTATPTNTASNNQNSTAINSVVQASTGTAAYFGFVEIKVSAYARNNISRQGTWSGGVMTTATTHVRSIGSLAWENVSNAITSIELNLAVGDFDTDTTYALYGIGTAT